MNKNNIIKICDIVIQKVETLINEDDICLKKAMEVLDKANALKVRTQGSDSKSETIITASDIKALKKFCDEYEK